MGIDDDEDGVTLTDATAVTTMVVVSLCMTAVQSYCGNDENSGTATTGGINDGTVMTSGSDGSSTMSGGSDGVTTMTDGSGDGILTEGSGDGIMTDDSKDGIMTDGTRDGIVMTGGSDDDIIMVAVITVSLRLVAVETVL